MFDEDGYMHYPQIRVSFGNELTVEEKSDIAQKLINSKIAEFSIDGDYFIVSLLDFDSETKQQKFEKYEKKWNTITALFGGDGGKDRGNKTTVISEILGNPNLSVQEKREMNNRQQENTIEVTFLKHTPPKKQEPEQ